MKTLCSEFMRAPHVIESGIATTRRCTASVRRRDPASNHLDGGLCRAARTGIVDPLEVQRSGFARGHKKAQVRIGRDARAHAHREHGDSVIAAGEIPDHVARDRLAAVVGAVSGLHRVADRNADLDRFALAGRGGQVDAGVGHGMRSSAAQLPSRQAAMVTMTSLTAAKSAPSLMTATATTCWLPASLMRESISTLGGVTGNSNTAISGTGLTSEKR